MKVIIGFIKKVQQKLKVRLEIEWNSLCGVISQKSRYSTERLGSAYGGWIYCPGVLDENFIVYSAGIGEDITFDLGLIEKYHCEVFAFDPTPRSIEWLKKQELPWQFKWFQYGVADYDGIASFFPPENKNYVSHSILDNHLLRGTPINVEVRKIKTIMKTLNHKQIDILKMDIEGAEYATLKKLLAEDLNIKQILVEFHHFFPHVEVWQTIQAVINLYFHGYKLISMSTSGHEYSFIRTRI